MKDFLGLKPGWIGMALMGLALWGVTAHGWWASSRDREKMSGNIVGLEKHLEDAEARLASEQRQRKAAENALIQTARESAALENLLEEASEALAQWSWKYGKQSSELEGLIESTTRDLNQLAREIIRQQSRFPTLGGSIIPSHKQPASSDKAENILSLSFHENRIIVQANPARDTPLPAHRWLVSPDKVSFKVVLEKKRGGLITGRILLPIDANYSQDYVSTGWSLQTTKPES